MTNKLNHLHKFGEYTLNAKERNLWLNEELIQMPPKVFDTLCLLVERHGEVLSKEEMLDAIWQDTFVEENNLSQNISALRRIFGKENNFIVTVPKRGFRFAASVKTASIEKQKHIETNGNGNFIIATQTKTHVIEETVLDDISSDAQLPDSTSLLPLTGKTIFGIALAVLFTSVFGFTIYNIYNSRQKVRLSIPLSTFDYLELTDTGNIISSTISPDGKFVAFLKESDDKTQDGISLYLMEIDSKNSVEIKIDGAIKPGFIQFSRDGKSIYFRTRGRPNQFENIYKISIFGGEPKLIAKDVWGLFSLSPDGTKIAHFGRDVAATKQQIIIRDIESSKEEIVFERPALKGFHVTGYPVFSPDSKKLAYIPFNKVENHSSLVVFNIKTKKEEILATNFRNVRKAIWNPNGKSFYLNAKEVGRQYQIWNLSYPDGKITRVTSDSNAYRSLEISADGSKISANRLNLYSNVWVLPDGDITRAKQLTTGENEIGGLLTTQFTPSREIIFNSRRKTTDGLWAVDIEGNEQRRLTKKDIGVQHNFAYAGSRNLIFFELDKYIWKMNLDGTNDQKIDLGEADRFSQPAVSPDERWLYYVKREKGSAAIWRISLEDNKSELVSKSSDYSPDTFLSVSPDGKYLAFVYVVPKKIGDNATSSSFKRKYGFFDLTRKSKVKIIEVSAYRSILRWTNGGKSFDFPSFTKNGSAILRKHIADDSPPETILELKNEIVYRFDWSRDGENLAISRGNHKMDVVVLKTLTRK